MGNMLSAVLLVLVFVLVGAAGYLVYDSFPRESLPLVPHIRPDILPPREYSSSVQFYPNMRFKSDRISYSIESACSSSKRQNALEAIDIVSRETVLSFYESDEPEITIICSQLPPAPTERRHFVAGEGGPTEILNGSDYSVILTGTFSLYRDESCATPHIALHELLHVLGFDHTENPASILYPTLDCAQTFDQSLIDELNRLYETPSLPDLDLVSATGNASGKYISFDVQIVNRGLADASDVSLRVYADDRFVKDFDLDDVPISARKTLTVSNLNVGRGTERITFEVDGTNSLEELREDNNKQELILPD